MSSKTKKVNFQIKSWDENTDRSLILSIYNAHRKHILSEAYVEQKKDIFLMLGDKVKYSRDFLLAENEKGEIVGVAGLTNFLGNVKSTRLIYGILPEYFNSTLPQQLLKAAIALGKKLKLSTLVLDTKGSNSAPFDNALEHMGYHPIQYLLEMHLTDFIQTTPVDLPLDVSILQKSGEPDNYHLYVDLINKSFIGSFEFLPAKAESSKKIFQIRKNQFDIEVFYVKNQQQPIGVSVFFVDAQKKIGTIYSVGILPEYRHRGIGTKLLEATIQTAKNQGCKTIQLDVHVDNEKALNLYQKLGFQSNENMKSTFYKVI
ncbi:GNAT family N-acetyltransferase [Promethearchaeum syntrophicum]|uniref:GNAT family N-acetyltransferase n=1 Tax=Promethearchaeum syntrophicum TaxID=2594042 RepID=A0A5B9D8X5_9ARCH|nr:GNAT family N-acetyltransferase [Candidatus Prometheoarchaeum syntrophicum]